MLKAFTKPFWFGVGAPFNIPMNGLSVDAVRTVFSSARDVDSFSASLY